MARGAFIGGMVGMQLQFFSLFSKLSIPWPNSFKTFLYILELCNLDPQDMFGQFDWPVFDFRVLFIFVANLLPLLITVLMLILFQPLYVVGWYILTVASAVMIVAGLVMHYLEGMDVGIWFACGGGFFLAICLAIGGTVYSMRRLDAEEKDEDDVEELQRKRRADALAFSLRRLIFTALTMLGLFFSGSILTGLFFTLSFSNRENNSLRVMGFICFTLSGFALLYFVTILTGPGREKLLRLGEFMTANFLMVMMLILSISYVPCITYCVNNFMCASYSCPAGSVFNPLANRSTSSYDRSSELFCDPCDFLDQRCMAASSSVGSSGSGGGSWSNNASNIAASGVIDPLLACPEWRGNRLWKSPEVPCGDAASVFFTLSALLVLPTYLLIIPLLYMRMIAKITNIISKETRLIPHNDKENVEYLPPIVQYERQVYAVEPAAASLYQPFKLKHKFAMISLLLLRLVMVVVTAVVAPYLPENVIWVLLGIHVATTAAIMVADPFIMKAEHYLTLGCSGCNILNCIYAVLVMYEVGLSDWVVWVLLGLNILIPAAMMIYTTKFINDANSKAEKDLLKHKKSMRNLAKKEKEGKKKDSSGGGGAAPAAAVGKGGGREKYSTLDKELGVPLMDLDDGGGLSHLDPFDDIDLIDEGPTRQSAYGGGGGGITVGSIQQQGGGGAPAVVAQKQNQRSRGLSKAATVEIPPPPILTEKQKKAILAKNSALATSLNYRTSSMITKYFMVIGFVLILALGASSLGYIRHTSTEFVDGTSSLQRSYEIVLGGYLGWENFTENCCCLMSTHPPTDYTLEERWVCENGIIVARGRIDVDGNSGLGVRDFCAVNFNVWASVTINNSYVNIHYWDMSELEGVSAEAQELLW